MRGAAAAVTSIAHEAAEPRADGQGAHKGADAARQVHHARARKVDHAGQLLEWAGRLRVGGR